MFGVFTPARLLQRPADDDMTAVPGLAEQIGTCPCRPSQVRPPTAPQGGLFRFAAVAHTGAGIAGQAGTGELMAAQAGIGPGRSILLLN